MSSLSLGPLGGEASCVAVVLAVWGRVRVALSSDRRQPEVERPKRIILILLLLLLLLCKAARAVI
jgi:hypothetical protein